MGIRIHKCLGYGLTDVQGDDDPRFSKNLYDLLEEIYETPIEEVFSRVDRLERGIQACVGTTFKYRKSFIREGQEYASFMTYDSEFGEENVVVFTPILFPNWQRYDDIIDYMDASGGEGAVNKVRVFDHNIYPFSNEMDKRNGKTVRTNIAHAAKSHHAPDSPFPEQLYVRDGARYATWGEAAENSVPEVPLDITLLCRAFNVFRADTTILQLRPMLYTYWG